jgi:hypothetical protein
VAAVSDENRFDMPEGIDLWVTEHGDRVVINRPNPLYQSSLATSADDLGSRQLALINRIFPNPTHTLLNVELKDLDTHQYRIFDIQGQIVREGQMRRSLNTMDISQLNAG